MWHLSRDTRHVPQLPLTRIGIDTIHGKMDRSLQQRRPLVNGAYGPGDISFWNRRVSVPCKLRFSHLTRDSLVLRPLSQLPVSVIDLFGLFQWVTFLKIYIFAKIAWQPIESFNYIRRKVKPPFRSINFTRRVCIYFQGAQERLDSKCMYVCMYVCVAGPALSETLFSFTYYIDTFK